MTIQLFLFAVGAGLVTFLGGLFSLKFKDKAHLITSFSAGVVLGLSFFDLLPESLELFTSSLNGFESTQIITTMIAVGFIFYLVLDRIFHTKREKDNHNHRGFKRSW